MLVKTINTFCRSSLSQADALLMYACNVLTQLTIDQECCNKAGIGAVLDVVVHRGETGPANLLIQACTALETMTGLVLRKEPACNRLASNVDAFQTMLVAGGAHRFDALTLLTAHTDQRLSQQARALLDV
jgi:hypothetical protein